MSKETIQIREIKPEDDLQVARVIRSVLVEMGAPKVGTAYEDRALDVMYETYNSHRSAYFVVDDGGEIIGGAGIAPLRTEDDTVCELQKMYFSPNARGQGLGSQMMAKCLEKAKSLDFEECYLETLPYMTKATQLYVRSGFSYLDGPMGNTGHYSCNVWMIKSL